MNPSGQTLDGVPSTDAERFTQDGVHLEAEVALAEQSLKYARSAYKSSHAPLQEVLEGEAALTTARQALAAHRTVQTEVEAQQEHEARHRQALALYDRLEEIRLALTASESEALLLLCDAELLLHRRRAAAQQTREAARTLRTEGRQAAARLSELVGTPGPTTGLKTPHDHQEWETLLTAFRLDDASVPDRMTAIALNTNPVSELAESEHRHRWLTPMAQIGCWLEMQPALPLPLPEEA
jgi:type IV secretory pathway VirJ component